MIKVSKHYFIGKDIKNHQMKILITGTAGFIGYHLAKNLLESGNEVIGLDSINDYYDVNLKYARLAETGLVKEDIQYGKLIQSNIYDQYKFVKLKLEDREGIDKIMDSRDIDYVCHLAAQAGVRYSLQNPYAYIESNINGFLNIIEASKRNKINHFVYASSSSVYGLNTKMPFKTSNTVDHPVSLYAATKKSNELIAHSYSHIFKLPTTGLRFFTVYGPWGRPDMALFLFTKAITEGKAIDVYNMGDMKRDFTYIDDIIKGVVHIINKTPQGNPQWNSDIPDPSSSSAPYKIYNIGNSSPVQLIEFIQAIEDITGKKAKKNYLPMQKGDIPATYADVEDLVKDFNYKPGTSIKEGVSKFIDWYKTFYMS